MKKSVPEPKFHEDSESVLRLSSGLREHGEILHSVSHPMSHPRWIQNSHFHPIGSRGTQCRGVRHFCWIQPQELFEFRICVRGHNHRLNCRDFVWRGCLRHVHRRYSKGVLPAKNRYFLILSLNPRAIDSARERAPAQVYLFPFYRDQLLTRSDLP